MMDQIKIGKFIASLRKEQKMTQEEMAEQLGVSNRSVSRWETGKNMPDVSLYVPLCYILGITVNELINGERIEEEQIIEKSEENIITTIEYSEKKVKKANKKLIAFSSLFIVAIVAILVIINGLFFTPCASYPGDTSDWETYFPAHSAYALELNEEGKPVFKNPSKALKQAKTDYSDNIAAIKKEHHLLPLSRYYYKPYKVYAWQVESDSNTVTVQGADLTTFLDIYENSFE